MLNTVSSIFIILLCDVMWRCLLKTLNIEKHIIYSTCVYSIYAILYVLLYMCQSLTCIKVGGFCLSNACHSISILTYYIMHMTTPNVLTFPVFQIVMCQLLCVNLICQLKCHQFTSLASSKCHKIILFRYVTVHTLQN